MQFEKKQVFPVNHSMLKEVAMKKRNNGRGRIAVTVLLCIVSIFLFGFIFNHYQSRITMEDIGAEMRSDSVKVRKYYSEAKTVSDAIDRTALGQMEYALELMRYLASHDSAFKPSRLYMQGLTKNLNVANVMLIDCDGNIIASANPAGKSVSDMLDSSGCESLLNTFGKDVMTTAATSHEIYDTDIEEVIGLEEDIETLPQEEEDQSGAKGVNASTEASSEEDAQISDETIRITRTSSIADYYMYALAINEEYAFVIEDQNTADQLFHNMMEPWTYVLRNEVIGPGGFVFVWSAVNNKILYYPDSKLRGMDISVLGMNLEKIVDGRFVWQKVNGDRMYLYPVFDQENKMWVVCACSENTIFRTRIVVALAIWIVFGIFAIVLTYYDIMLLRSREIVTETNAFISERNSHFQSRKVRMLIFTLFSAIIIFLSAFYLQTLYRMSDWAKRSEKTIQSAKDVMDERDVFVQYYPEVFVSRKERLARTIAQFLEANPDQITISTLNELAEKLDLVQLQVTDSENKVIAVSSYSSVRSDVQEDAADSTEAASGSNVLSSADYSANVKTVMSDSNDQMMGTLTLSYVTLVMDEIVKSQSVDSVLRRIQPGEGSFLFCIDKDSTKVIAHPNKEYIGRTAEEYGLDKKDIRENLCGVVKLNRNLYYVLSAGKGTELLYVAIRERDILKQRLPLSGVAAIMAFVLLNLIGIAVYMQKETVSHVTLEHDRSMRFGINTPEYKALKALVLFAICAAAFVALYSLVAHEGDNSSVLDYVLNGNWEPGLNAFALTSAIVTLSRGCILIFLIRRIAYLMAGILPIRVATIIRMLTSLFSYVGTFLVLYSCCIDFGMPATALMASAGVVSVVLGIGANSLVGDIIAGMFLLTEGYVQVGDTIEVNGFTGIVQELGIRVTTLYCAPESTVKIIPNRDVQDVVHRSMFPAMITIEFQIEYSEDLERVEVLLQEELKKMPGEIEGLIGTPVYLGVHKLDSDGVVLKVRIQGREMDRYALNREVNRRIYLMFVRNHISVPYPQIMLHQAIDMTDQEQTSEEMTQQEQ